MASYIAEVYTKMNFNDLSRLSTSSQTIHPNQISLNLTPFQKNKERQLTRISEGQNSIGRSKMAEIREVHKRPYFGSAQ